MERRASGGGRKVSFTMTTSSQSVISVSDRAFVVGRGGGTGACILFTGGLSGADLTREAGELVLAGIVSIITCATSKMSKRILLGICGHLGPTCEMSTNAKPDWSTSALPSGTTEFFAVSVH